MDPSYNNSFGSSTQGGVGAPISSGTGDIILDSSSSKKPKKGLIILIVVLVLAIIGLVVAYFVLKPNGKSAIDPSSYGTEFNRFANYVMSGEENNNRINNMSDDYSETFFVREVGGEDVSVENRSNVLKKTDTLYDGFLEKYTTATADNNNNDEGVSVATFLNQNIVEMKGMIEFMKMTSTKERITTDSITEYYIANGKEAALAEIENYYVYPSEDYEYISSFRDTLESTASMQLDILDIYSQNNCLNIEGSSYECMQGVSDETTLNNLVEQTLELEKDLAILESYYIEPSELVGKTIMINSLMYEGVDSEYWNEGE